MKNIYLDNAATTPVDPRVFDAMLPWLRDEYGNPSSVHAHGRAARSAVEKAREHVAGLFGSDPSEIVFTSGGTESDNTAIVMMLALAKRSAGLHIISSKAEHHAVLQPFENLENEGVHVDFIDVDVHAAPRIEGIQALLTASQEKERIMSMMHVNNETGGILDITASAEIAAAHGILFHSDMVQSAGKIPIHIHDHHIHFASLSAHKIHGPKGVGALYVKSGTDVIAWMTGGSQERGRRGGTENLIGIVGLGEAARLALLEMNERLERWREYSRECRSLLQSAFGHVIINGEEGSTLPNICSISFPAEHYPIDGEMLTVQCDLSGLSVSSGSACTAGSIIPSHVMKAIGHDDATSVATVRLSFGAQTTIEDVRSGTGILVKVVQEMLERSNPRSHSRIAMP